MTTAKVKGTGLMTIVKALRDRRDLVEPLLPPELRAYLDERILVASWYPEEHYQGMMAALANLAPSAAEDAWVWMGDESAGVDLVEIYSSMVQKGNPWGTLQRLPRLWKLYHDSGRADAGFQGDTKAQIMVSEYTWCDDRFGRFMVGYLRRMLALAGAEGVEVVSLGMGDGRASPSRWRATWVGR